MVAAKFQRYGIGLLIAAAWWMFALLAPSHIGWRDSGEFLIGPFFLDILHPAGFPTYSQLANGFALLPLGNIAWRVYLFSAACGLGLLCLSSALTFRLIGLTAAQSLAVNSFASCLPPLVLLHTESFWKGVFSAEAYLLNANFALLGLLCITEFARFRDARYLIAASFAAGLGVGNHASLAWIALWLTPGLMVLRPPFKRLAFPMLGAGLCGALVYGYLPVRSMAAPPLDTGGVSSIESFVDQVTDARDRYARAKSETSFATAPRGVMTAFLTDTLRLAREMPPLASIAALLGIGCLIRQRISLGLCIIGALFATLTFFSGWDSDPWIVALALAAASAGVGVAAIGQIAKASPYVPAAAGVLCLISVQWPSLFRSIGASRDHRAAGSIGREIVDSIGSDGVLVSESSYFVLRYLTSIEGYRDDLALVYQPRLLWPHLFGAANFSKKDGAPFVSQVTTADKSVPNFSNAAKFVSYAAEVSAIRVEITPLFLEKFRAILQFLPGQLPLIRFREPGTFDPNYLESVASRLRSLAAAIEQDRSFFRLDSQNYLEVILSQQTALASPDWTALLPLYEAACGKDQGRGCSVRTRNNLGLALLGTGRSCEAARLFAELSSGAPTSVRNAVESNRLLAENTCGGGKTAP